MNTNYCIWSDEYFLYLKKEGVSSQFSNFRTCLVSNIMPETIIYRKSFFCIRCLGSKWAASLFRNFCMIFAETVERQNKAFKMLDLPGIKFVLSLSFLAYANAQFTNGE